MQSLAMAVRQRFVIFIGAALVSRLLMLALVDVQATLWTGDTTVLMAGGSYVPPGYPLFLRYVPQPILIQSLLTIGVGWLVGSRLNFAAGLLYVTSPFLILFEWRLLTESLAVNLTVVAFTLTAFPRHKSDVIVGGAAMAAAILVRDTLLFLPLLFLFDRRAWPAIAACYLLLAPVQLSRGSVTLSEGRMGLNLWKGSWERFPSPNDRGFDANANYPPEAFASADEKSAALEAIARRDDARLRQIAIDRLKQDPGLIANWFIRQPYMWLGTRTELHELRLERGSFAWKCVKGAFWLLNAITLAAGLAAIAMTRRYILLIPLAYLAAIYLPFHSTEPRYSLFALPFLYAAIALLITSRLNHGRWWNAGRRSTPSPAGQAPQP